MTYKPILQLQLPDPRNLILLLALSLLMAFRAASQCSVEIDFNDWLEAGPVNNGDWSVPPNGESVLQTINGDPTFFIGPNDFMNVTISGTIRVDENTLDDDFVGFVFSVVSPESASPGNETTFDMWLLDWKSGAQSSADEGFSLIKIQDTFDFSDDSSFMPYFWTHNTNSTFDIKEQVFGEGLGWVPGQAHNFELTLRSDMVTIKVDGNQVLQREDCFDIGKFGFYNFSQENVNYSNFSYEIFSEFSVPDELCAGVGFVPEVLNSNCTNTEAADLNSIISNWFWQFGNDEYSFQMLPEHTYEEAGEYTISLTVTDVLGCSAEVTETIIIHEKASVSIEASSGCVGDELFFSATNESSNADVLGYAWDFDNDGFSDDSGEHVSEIFNSSGEFPIQVVAISSGCNDTVSATINVTPLPTADFDYQLISGRTIQFENYSSDADTYSWDFGDNQTSIDPNPMHLFQEDNDYTVSLTAENNGCFNSTEKTLTILYQDNTFLPTAFSPNGDGANDSFRILGSDLLEMEMCVFNHWGELIFIGNDISSGWNGQVSGNNAQAGNYTYQITGTKSNGEKVNYQGLVALVR